VLQPHPGRVQEMISVPVPRPRHLAQWSGPEFQATKARLEALIDPQRHAQAAGHPTASALESESIDNLPMIRMTHVGDEVE
jgi:NitT/TauT family transport system ATP-binding protein